MDEVMKPVKVMVVAQQKGGVGKTTIARMLAMYAAREDLLGKRVLMMDFDYQASLSKLSLDMEIIDGITHPPIMPEYEPGDTTWNGRSSVADLFLSENGAVPYQVRYPYPIDNLDIFPAFKPDLQAVEECDRTSQKEAMLDRLRVFSELDEVKARYDLIIIDTGPKESPLVTCALRAATHLVVPLVLETQCLDGMSEMMSMWNRERANRPGQRDPLILAGLIINKADPRYSIHKALKSKLENDPWLSVYLCPEYLPQRAGIVERDMRNARPATLFDLPKTEDIRETALAVCADIYGKVFPEEADRMANLSPDPDYAQKVEARIAAHKPAMTQAEAGA